MLSDWRFGRQSNAHSSVCPLLPCKLYCTNLITRDQAVLFQLLWTECPVPDRRRKGRQALQLTEIRNYAEDRSVEENMSEESAAVQQQLRRRGFADLLKNYAGCAACIDGEAWVDRQPWSGTWRDYRISLVWVSILTTIISFILAIVPAGMRDAHMDLHGRDFGATLVHWALLLLLPVFACWLVRLFRRELWGTTHWVFMMNGKLHIHLSDPRVQLLGKGGVAWRRFVPAKDWTVMAIIGPIGRFRNGGITFRLLYGLRHRASYNRFFLAASPGEAGQPGAQPAFGSTVWRCALRDRGAHSLAGSLTCGPFLIDEALEIVHDRISVGHLLHRHVRLEQALDLLGTGVVGVIQFLETTRRQKKRSALAGHARELLEHALATSVSALRGDETPPKEWGENAADRMRELEAQIHAAAPGAETA